jgi:hypothetical protein
LDALIAISMLGFASPQSSQQSGYRMMQSVSDVQLEMSSVRTSIIWHCELTQNAVRFGSVSATQFGQSGYGSEH